ncbi:MAG TPA: adenylate/guanylate cyclase domain-containing protein [Candidatus Binataceae bacterium]|nr:adenylate/guanylate cyclase domain-containing protein [Candidatus Binataceae bacterium]
MTFDEVLAQVLELLQREKRISYRALKRRFLLDDEYLEDLKSELIDAKQLAIDENGTVLVWNGSQPSPPEPKAAAASTPSTLPSGSNDGERRQLTVMFCDLVGSTALSEQFDPEELRDLVRAYQQNCIAVISRFEGYIAKYLGDGVLAYFGYPHAHEDDAQRAVHAGLGIVAAMRSFNLQRGETSLASLRVRVAIHTGLVVVGEMGGGDFREQSAIVGDTPNAAARLQEIADPDSVVISAATYQLIRGLFDCESLGARSLKGFTNPVQAYRVLRESEAHNRFDVAIQTGLAPMVGRDSECAILKERWERAPNHEGQIVLVSGEPGVGKSRLLQAFKEEVAKEPDRCWLECHCSPYHQNSALYPVIDLLQRLLRFEPLDGPVQKLAKLVEGLEQYGLPPAENVSLIAPLLTLPVPETYPRLTLTLEAQKEKTYFAVQSWLLTIAERTGLALVFEDLHWADPSTLELLGHLIEQVPTARLLLVLTCRPEFSPPWSSRSHFASITLNRLPRSQTERMVQNVTGGKLLPGQVLEQIIAKTDGVPLFVEELTRMVVESGLLRERDGHYDLSGPLPPLAIPSTLQDSLTARLDRLGDAREVAQLAATIGRDFPYELLRLIGSKDEASLQRALGRLVEAEVLYRRGVMPQAQFLFKHALIRDAAYESLLKSKRQQVHSRIAQALKEEFADLAKVQPELVAHHYTQAGLSEAAVPYWQKAGELALERCAFQESINQFIRALSLLPPQTDGLITDTQEQENGELRCTLLLAVGEAQRRGGQPVKAQETLLLVTTAARTLASADIIARAAFQFSLVGLQFGLVAPPSTIRWFEDTLAKLGSQDSPLKAAMLGALANVLPSVGANQRALEYGQQAAAMARRLGEEQLLPMILDGVCFALQSPLDARRRLAYANEMVESSSITDPKAGIGGLLDRQVAMGFALWWRLYSALQLANIEAAREDLGRYNRWVEDRREPFLMCLVNHFHACEASLEGRFADFERFAQEALAIGQALEVENAAGIFGTQMFTLRREQGRLREVEPLLRYFIRTPEGAHAWRPGLALIYAELGRTEEAAAEFDQLAQRDFSDLPQDGNWLIAMTYLADVCVFLGDKSSALTLYEMMRPYQQVNILISVGSACLGSASRFLGALATLMGRWDEAEQHFDDALTMNQRMAARPWLAHTQYQFARMLLSRDQPGDSAKAGALIEDALATARELGMVALEQRITNGAP